MKKNKPQNDISTGWQELKLGAVLTVGSGKDYKHLEKGGIPVFGTGGYMLSVNKALYSGETVFIGRKGTIDKPFYFKGDFWTVDTLFYTYNYRNTNARYINLVFQKINWKLYNEASGVPSLSKNTIEKIKFVFPPLPEQKRIVSVLEVWDEMVEKLARKIEIKKNIKKGLMQELLSGKKRLAGFDEEWKTVKLGDICEIKKGQALSKEKICIDGKHKCVLYGELYTKYSDLIKNVVSKTNTKEGVLSVKGDILIPASTTTSAIDLAIAACLNEKDVLLGGDINILRSKKEYDSRFLALYLTNTKKHSLARLAQGITIVHLYGKDFIKINIEIPSIKEQKAIADILVMADREIEKLEEKLRIIKEQKKFLLNNLITGNIRTPENMK